MLTMIKIMLTISLIASLSTPLLAQTKTNIWSAGGPFNPYVIQTGPGGKTEIKTQYPDLSQPLLAPGQPFNPYYLRHQPGGTTTLQTDLPAGVGDNSAFEDD